MKILNSKSLSEKYNLEPRTIRLNAHKCPGSQKLGRDWVFLDNKETHEFFAKIKPRKKGG